MTLRQKRIEQRKKELKITDIDLYKEYKNEYLLYLKKLLNKDRIEGSIQSLIQKYYNFALILISILFIYVMNLVWIFLIIVE